jgi:hypothetical protein
MPAGEKVSESNLEIEIALMAMSWFSVATEERCALNRLNDVQVGDAPIAERAFWKTVPVRVEETTKWHASVTVNYGLIFLISQIALCSFTF